VASFTKTPSHQSFGCCMPSPTDLQYMLGGKLGVPHFQLTNDEPDLSHTLGQLLSLDIIIFEHEFTDQGQPLRFEAVVKHKL